MLMKMSPRKLSLAFGAALLLLASPLARAGFVNGGFENGDFSGWTLEYGYNGGVSDFADPNASISFSSTLPPWHPAPQVVDKAGYTDPYVSNISNAFVGDKMALINDINGNNHVTRLSQTGVIDAADLAGALSATVYINWVSVMEDPGHEQSANPWFNIEVLKNGSPIYNVTHFSNEAGWTESSPGWSIFNGAGQATVAGLLVGDSVTVRMTVGDCAYGGHGAYAYLDGIGTTKVPDPHGVPDAASTLGLLGLGLAGLVGLRRRR